MGQGPYRRVRCRWSCRVKELVSSGGALQRSGQSAPDGDEVTGSDDEGNGHDPIRSGRWIAVFRLWPGILQRARDGVARSAQRHEPRPHAKCGVPEPHEGKESPGNWRYRHNDPTLHHGPPPLLTAWRVRDEGRSARIGRGAAMSCGGGSARMRLPAGEWLGDVGDPQPEHRQQVVLHGAIDLVSLGHRFARLEAYKVGRPVWVEVDHALEAHVLRYVGIRVVRQQDSWICLAALATSPMGVPLELLFCGILELLVPQTIDRDDQDYPFGRQRTHRLHQLPYEPGAWARSQDHEPGPQHQVPDVVPPTIDRQVETLGTGHGQPFPRPCDGHHGPDRPPKDSRQLLLVGI